jgi:hypothetical protein
MVRQLGAPPDQNTWATGIPCRNVYKWQKPWQPSHCKISVWEPVTAGCTSHQS